MQGYILRRLLQGGLTAFLVSLLIFVILRVAPGDVALMIAQSEAGDYYTQEMVDRLREQLGLNAPLPVQYVTWIKGILTLDWGTSMFGEVRVWESFRQKAPLTLELMTFSIVLSTLIGLPLGVIMALKQDTWIDYATRVFSLAGLSIPNFWIATVFLAGGLYLLGWSPRLEYRPFWEDPLGNLSMFLWPALIVGYSSVAIKARMMRSTMLEVLRQDYIRTARAKGLRNFVVTYRHALKNAMLPVITIVGISIAGIMSGSVIMERIFVLPGVGNYLVEGMNYRDYPVVQSVVLVFAMWTVAVNLLVDLTYGWLDPRIRYN